MAAFKLGDGYSTFRQAGTNNKVVDFTEAKSDASHESHITVCSSSEQVYNALNVDVSVAFEIGDFKGDNKFSFARSLAKESNAVTILITATRSVRRRISSAALTSDWKGKSAAEIHAAGGDRFVSEVVEGAQYLAAYQYLATSVQKKLDIADQCHLQFLGNTADIDVKLKEMDKKTNMSSSLKETTVGYDGQTADGKVDKLQEALKAFMAATTLDAPATLSFKTQSYTIATGCPADFGKVAANYDAYHDGSSTRPSCSAVEAKINVLVPNIESMRNMYAYYGESHPKFNEALKRLNDLRDRIVSWRRAIHRDPFTPATALENMDYGCLETPEAHFRIDYGKFFGADNGGDRFDDVNEDMIPYGVYMKSVSCAAGSIIDCIRTEYAFRSHAREPITIARGDAKGTAWQPTIHLEPRRIGWVEAWREVGRWEGDHCIQKICFSYWGEEPPAYPRKMLNPGEKGGVDWSGHVVGMMQRDDGWFVGWAGRASKYIYSLGPTYVIFSPPTWEPVKFSGDSNSNRPSD